MDDPLKRRMFAQQIANQYSQARQPMGILASSPQLMNAVQGYANGGAVKGYNLGGYESLSFGDRLVRGEGILQAQKNVEQDKKIKNTGIDDTGVADQTLLKKLAKQSEKEQIEGKPLSEIEKNIKQSNAIRIDDFSKNTTGDVKLSAPKVDQNAQIQEPGAVINETNEKLTQTDKELKDNIPKGKNLGAKTDTSEIDAKIQAASTSYEGFKKKLETTDKRYEADEAKRTDYTSKIQKLMEEEDEISLEDVDKKARDVLGLKKGEYDDDRVTAFWMSMIKGGLATAAGESSNALTNIAKGLMFGVDSYGKDMNNITLQEREDRQNLAKMKYNLMKDESSAKIAERTLKIQAYGELAKLDFEKFKFKSEQEYKVARNETLDNLAMAKLDLTSMQVLNGMKMGDKNYEAKIREISLNEKKQDDYVRLTEKQLSQQLRDKNSTKEIKNIFALGSDYATYEDGEFKFTDKGKSMLIAATASKTKFTDLVTTAKAIGANKVIEGYKYETSDKAEDAYYYYEGVVKPQLKKLDELSKKLSGGIDAAEYDRRKQALMVQFAKDTGGILGGSTGGSTSLAVGDIVKQGPNRFKYLGDGQYEQIP